jgi:hypothetical protein
VFTVNAAEIAALAGPATRADVTSATADAIAISGFFSEVIILLIVLFFDFILNQIFVDSLPRLWAQAYILSHYYYLCQVPA